MKTSLFGEADLIVTYLTKDFGIFKAFAKSPRKTRSKFGSSLEPLTYSKISFWGKENSSLPRLVQSDIVHPFHSLRSSLHCFLKVSEICEVTLHFVPERDGGDSACSLLLNTLHLLEQDCSAGLLILFYKLKLLEMAGFLPSLNACGRCGKAGNAFYLSHGTVLCIRCAKDPYAAQNLSPAVTSLCLNLLCWDMNKLNRIKPAEKIVQELTVLVDEHINYVTERRIRTKTFISPGIRP